MKVHVEPTPLRDLRVVRTQYSRDHRGWFVEPWNARHYAEAGLDITPVEAGHSLSFENVLRGMHYQNATAPMGKLVRCTRGTVYDVAIDLRTSSDTFGKWFGITLSSSDPALVGVWVPPGFAHGLLSLSAESEVEYLFTGRYTPEAEGAIRWDDPDVGVEWPLKPGVRPILSAKDASAGTLREYRADPSFR